MSGRRDDGAVDLREIGIALRHGYRFVLAGAVVGLALGFAVTLWVPDRYEGTSVVLVRASPDLARSALSSLGGLGEMIGGLDGTGGSELETELEILGSRTVIGEVVDSLLLQAVIREPRGMSARTVFTRVEVEPFVGTRRFELERDGGVYVVRGDGVTERVAPGGSVSLPGASLTLVSGDLPDRLEVGLRDRADAIDAVRKDLRTRSLTADVAEVIYRAPEPATAAAVPNLLVSEYLERRTSTDRGANQERYEFLVEQTDSVTRELAMAEAALRVHQETSGVMDPALVGETQLTRAMELRGELETIDIERGALQRIADAEGIESMSRREMAAYPTFLQNAAINDVLSRMLELETERLQLLQQRTPTDPDVVAVSEGIENLEDQLESLSAAYMRGLERQRVGVVQELDQYAALLRGLPQQAEESFRRMREVERLAEVRLVLESQLVQARLAAIGEGGEVRQIDPAIPPKRPAFPSSGFVLLAGLLGGVFFGAASAVGSGVFRQRVRESWEAELATGLPATTLGPGSPLAFPEVRTARSLLLLPIGAEGEARSIGRRIVETATFQGREAVLADLTAELVSSGTESASRTAVATRPATEDSSRLVLDLPTGSVTLPLYHAGGAEAANRPRALLAHLEERFSFVVAVVPQIGHPAALSVITPERPVVLVARSSGVSRSQLSDAVETVERCGGRVAGIVLQPSKNGRNE
ncbi:MAG: Wzz/FepE/Etk N-terminal domain-containing protein [Gemmatimonadota bacterium]